MSKISSATVVQRWAFDISKWLPERPEWCAAMRSVQIEERVRIRKFHYAEDAKASLVGRLLLRKMAKAVIGLKEEEIVFTRSDKGRPQLTSTGPNWDFNISHQGDFVALVAASNPFASEKQPAMVGVDVMRITDKARRDVPEFFRLMRRQFTSYEWETIKNCSDKPEEQMRMFYRHWCLKESFVKAEGSGLNWDLQRLSFKARSIRNTLYSSHLRLVVMYN